MLASATPINRTADSAPHETLPENGFQLMAPKIPTVAIIGRPNVGKSTLFNRIYGERKAIVEDFPGVTRDRLYAMVERYSVSFLLIDTGGIDSATDDQLSGQVKEQALIAAEEADVLLVLFDGAEGCQEGDREVVELLRRYPKPTYFVVNKCDGNEQALRKAEFYALGVDPLYDISALHGRRVADLVEEMLHALPNYTALRSSAIARREREAEGAKVAQRLAAEDLDAEAFLDDHEMDPDSDISVEDDIAEEGEELSEPRFAPVYVPDESGMEEGEYDRTYRMLPLEESKPRVERPEPEDDLAEYGIAADDTPEPVHIDCIKIAIVGRPNVGKSTLLNTLTGDQRAITSPIAGTTRDNLDVTLRRDGQEFCIIDTAGLRKKARIHDAIERYSTLRAIGTLSECDVAVMVIDGATGPSEQDTKILGLAHERGVGIVIVVNKWDLVTKSHKTVHKFTENLRETFKFAPYAPILYVSAISGRRCPRIIETAREVAYERLKRVPTRRLNDILKRAMVRSAPSPYRGREIKMYYASQIDVAPPRFTLFFNYPRVLHFSFLRYLKNAIRGEFKFEGTEIKLVAKRR